MSIETLIRISIKSCLVLSLLCLSCASMTDAEKAQLVIDGAKVTCAFFEQHPEALKPEQAELLAEVCPVLATAQRE